MRKVTEKKSDMRFGAIDVGTNSIHVIVVELDPYVGSIHTIFKAREMVRLGAGDALKRSRLGKKALARGIEVISNFVARARAVGATDVRIVATSAVRDAENKAEFVHAVTARTGCTVEVLSGRDEARLIHLGVSRGNVLDEHLSCIIDIGGGSTEIIIADRHRTYALHSLPLGSLRMYERFRRGNDLDVEALQAYVKHLIEPVCAPLRSGESLPGNSRIEKVIGTSGTWIGLAALDAGSRGVEFSRSAGARLTRAAMETLQVRMTAMNGDTRKAMPGMNPRRSDIIVAGNGVAIELLRALDQEMVQVCDHALREGIIVDYLRTNHDRVQALGDERLRRLDAVRDLAQRLRGDLAHESRVADFALALYDGMNEHSRFDTTDRDILFGAAILHDVGWAVNQSSHHKHSAYIVRNASLLGWKPMEQELLALLVRYHRRSLPKPTHTEYFSLDPVTRQNVDSLTALLRIADGLDALRKGTVKRVEMKRSRDRFTIFVHADGDVSTEIDSARAKADLFARRYGMLPVFEVVAMEEQQEAHNDTDMVDWKETEEGVR
jgi:exopolyphosphatase/guanosine-5'-triphosphate,3'-diphosphate pyrophosphatase